MRSVLPLIVVLAFGCSETEYSTFTDTREEQVTQSFEVRGVRTDILFFGDTSYSMQNELRRLADNVDSFTSRLDESDNDWQLITVTGPDGCATSGILNGDTPNIKEAFKTGILTEPGQDFVDEWGLFNVFKAVLGSAPGQCNEGFVRDDSILHIIFLSDEDDNSPGWELGGEYWKDYVDPVLYYKGEPSQVRFSAITGPTPDGCSGADPGFGYTDAVAATGGEFLSICDNWYEQVGLLADASILQAFFEMDWPPIDDSLKVWVNDEERSEGWRYDDARGGLLFTADLPTAWDKIDIEYRALVEFEVKEPAQ